MTNSRSSNPPDPAGDPPSPAGFTDDEKRIITAGREAVRRSMQDQPSWWVYETLGLMHGELERRWIKGQWRTVHASTGKPMKLDSVIRWWTSRTAPVSPTDE